MKHASPLFATRCGHSRLFVSALLLAGLTTQANAQSSANAPSAPAEASPAAGGPPLGWSGAVFLGAVTAPRYPGSREARQQAGAGVEFSHRSDELGMLSLGNRGLSWAPDLPPPFRLKLGLDIDPGRLDKDERKRSLLGYRPGGAMLKGMGEIKATGVVTASGAYELPALGGLELTGGVRQALKSHRGRQLDLGLSYPLVRSESLNLALAPGLSWADLRHQQAFFGVSAAQAAATGRPVFTPKAGIKSLYANVELDMALTDSLRLQASLQIAQLRGDAARSPLTQRTRQIDGFVGVVYPFQL